MYLHGVSLVCALCQYRVEGMSRPKTGPVDAFMPMSDTYVDVTGREPSTSKLKGSPLKRGLKRTSASTSDTVAHDAMTLPMELSPPHGFTVTLRQSFIMACGEKRFGRSWFVILLLATQHDKALVAGASFLALTCQAVLAGTCDRNLWQAIPEQTFHFCAAAICAVYALLSIYAWCHAHFRLEFTRAGKEAAESIVKSSATCDYVHSCRWAGPFVQCFLSVFSMALSDGAQNTAEGAHLSHWVTVSMMAVCVGSFLALLLLTVSAVAVGISVRKSTTSKVIHICRICGFASLAALAMYGGMRENMLRHVGNEKMAYCVLCREGVEPYIAKTRTEPPFLIRTLSPYIESFSHRSIHREGMWEWHVYSEIRETLAPLHCADNALGQSVSLLDFGSNVGFHTLYGLKLGCGVLSVDVGTVHLHHLKSSLQINDMDGQTLRVVRGFVTNYTGEKTYSYGTSVSSETVPAFRIDDLLLKEGLDTGAQIPLAKMDVEDGVAAALQGAEQTLRSHRVRKWIIEVWSPAKVREMRAVLAHVVSLGYRGRFMCCEHSLIVAGFLWSDDHAKCSFTGIDDFARAWAKAFNKPGEYNCDAILEAIT